VSFSSGIKLSNDFGALSMILLGGAAAAAADGAAGVVAVVMGAGALAAFAGSLDGEGGLALHATRSARERIAAFFGSELKAMRMTPPMGSGCTPYTVEASACTLGRNPEPRRRHAPSRRDSLQMANLRVEL
jgi:hypothetical protein